MDVVDLSVKLDLSVQQKSLKSLAESVFGLVDQAQSTYLGLDAPEIHVWVEQGSLSYRAKIIIGLSSFVSFVSGYGGFVDGVEKILDHSKKVINYVNEKLITPNPSKVIDYRRSAGTPEKIKSIIRLVQEGKLSPDEATEKVTRLLENEEDEGQLKEIIVESFRQSAQQEFRSPSTQLKAFSDDEFTVERKKVPSKPPASKLPKDEPSLYGVELWYDKRTGLKKIRKYTK